MNGGQGFRAFKAVGRLRPGEMNRYEAEHATRLEAMKQAGEVQWYSFQPLRLGIAAHTTYQPDFMVILADGTVEFHEIKGGLITDDGWVKLKVAARQFPMFTFVRCQKVRKQWERVEVPA